MGKEGLALSPPRMPPVAWQGRALAKRRLADTLSKRVVRFARRAPPPGAPAFAPLSPARSPASGKHARVLPVPSLPKERAMTDILTVPLSKLVACDANMRRT